MMLGARTAAWAKAGGWVNPYITDGLVAMWDGEWNAGGGVHREVADVWNDLVGANDLTLTGTSSVRQKSIVLGNDSCYLIPVSLAQRIYDGARSGNLTVEIVGGPSVRANNFGYFTIKKSETETAEDYYSAISIRMNNSTNGNFEYRRDNTHTTLFVNGYVRYENTVNKATLIFGTSGLSWSYRYSTTERKGTIENPSIEAQITSGMFGSDRIVNKSQSVFYGMRIYSRALSASEIAANYAIDKARFNLT